VILILDATDFGDDITYARRRRVAGNGVTFDVPDRTPLYLGRMATVASPPISLLACPFRFALKRLGPDDPYAYSYSYYKYYKFELRLGERTETSRYFIFRYPPDITVPFFEATLEHIRRIAAAVNAGVSGERETRLEPVLGAG
jgi:hypothetical protein